MKVFIYICFFVLCLSTFSKTVSVLSIDGGGIRGIIPIIVLQEIEHRLSKASKNQRHIHEYFDIMSGASTGGIIVLLLSLSEDKKTPKYNISEVVNFYSSLGDRVFERTFLHRIWSLSGWTGDKYNPAELESLLQEYMKNLTLIHTMTNVIIPSYDIAQQRMKFFSSYYASQNSEWNYFLKDVARGTSAAPTFFPPAIVYNVDRSNTNILVDGGIAANNPTLCACVHAVDIYGKDIDLIVLSIGTGSIEANHKSALSGKSLNLNNMGLIDWAPILVPTMMDSSNDIVDYQMKHIVGKKYFRLQIDIDPDDSSMDDASDENIDKLERYAHQLIDAHNETIDEIVELLVNKVGFEPTKLI